MIELTMSTATFVDVEGALKQWLKAQPGVSSVFATRIYFGVPEGSPTTPFAVLSRIGGSPLGGEAPMELARVTIMVWAGTKKVAFDAVAAVANALAGMNNEPLDDSVFGYGATVESLLWLPEPNSGMPRYACDATLAVRAL